MYGRLVIRNIGSSMAMDERRGRINVPGQYFLLKGIQKAAINHPSLIYGFWFSVLCNRKYRHDSVTIRQVKVSRHPALSVFL